MLASDSQIGPWPALNALEQRRAGLGVTRSLMVARAGLTLRTYQRFLAGQRRPLSATVKRLARALDELAGARPAPVVSPSRERRAAEIRACWNGFLSFVAPHYGLTADEIRATRNFRSFDGRVHAARRAQQAAIYLVSVVLEAGQAEIARALGLTPAAVCIALQAVEDRRDDPVFDALLDRAQREVDGSV